MDPLDNFPLPWERALLFKNSQAIWTSHGYKKSPGAEDIAVSMASSGYYACFKNKDGCDGKSADTKAAMNNLLNNTPASYAGMVLQIKDGTYYYACSRNNNFSNRSQKGRLYVTK
jgi:cephalosporin-C deacetylase-like acetyl esterase